MNDEREIGQACKLCERDIDLTLLEELYCSAEFRSWFLYEITGKSGVFDFDAKRSVAQTLGETDLEVWFSDAEGVRWTLLIENKIAADFQEQQGQRYKLRAEEYVESGEADKAVTVLIAPRTFNKSQCELFEVRFDYERVSDWFKQRPADIHARYKAVLLDAALQKAADGYVPVIDAGVTEFWRNYWSTAMQVAPELNMREPGNKPARAGFVRFWPLGLPTGTSLIHKLRYGLVDLQYHGYAKRLHELQRLFGEHLAHDMRVDKATGAGVIRIVVEKVRTDISFDSQKKHVIAALHAARRLSDLVKLVPAAAE